MQETIKQFTDYFGNFGYAFARVESRPEIDRSNNAGDARNDGCYLDHGGHVLIK